MVFPSSPIAVGGRNVKNIEVDIDKLIFCKSKDKLRIYRDVEIIPQNVQKKTVDYWRDKLAEVDAEIVRLGEQSSKWNMMPKQIGGQYGYTKNQKTGHR
ncbi:MAG: hypothetical protein Q4D97_01170 [Eubacteriales bacterium]|nr:hypothetical protein [Eubacteriales bacterium]